MNPRRRLHGFESGPRALALAAALACASLLGTLDCARAQETAPAAPQLPRQEGVAPNFTYYTATADRRRCAAPLCGGFFVTRVNAAQTRCADGKLRDSCYVVDVDFAALRIGQDPGPDFRAQPELFLLRGAQDPVSFPQGELDVLRVSEAFVGTPGASASGTFFRVRSTGIVCVTTPCPSLAAQVLSSAQPPEAIAGIDASPELGDFSAALARVDDPQGLLASAARFTVTGPAGTGTGLRVQQAYLPFQARSAGRACGSRGLPACAELEYCSFAPEAMCGRADAPGVCAPRPEVCIEIFQPVCGCDGQTYSNACVASVAGVSVDPAGTCDRGMQ
jgi:hypothetical protein